MKRVFKISKKIALAVLTIAFILIGFGVLPSISPFKNPNKVTLSADTWNSDLVEIDKGSSSNVTKYVSISDYVTLDSEGLVTAVKDYSAIDANTVIKIESGLDLYYFAELCNPNFSSDTLNDAYTKFLTFNYVLACDINYEDASQTFKMLRPIGWSQNYPFSGTFDGQGNIISNIFYRPLEDETEAETYSGLVYFALFSVNTGIVKNVGIVNPNMIQYDIYEDIEFVSPFVGYNNGLVENCYVQDFRGNSAGMSAEGGYITSMFASGNGENGTIQNCYVAVDRITSPTISMTSASNRYPFITGNKGTLKNCYFDKHILDLNTTYTQETFTGLSGIQTTEFLDVNVFEHYVKDADNNITDQIWFSNATYDAEYSSYLKLNYPVLKGFEVKTVENVKYFCIKDANDLVLMSEYIDQYQAFRTASYLLVNSVDLKTVRQDAFVFTDAVFSGKLVGTTKSDDGYSVTLSDGTYSNQTSIFNLQINKGNSYNGYRCYGLFSVLAGTVESINLVDVTIDESDIATVNLNEINTLGAVCGLLEGGTINNVNVSVNITLTNGSTTFLGTQQVGGLCGTTLSGTISNSTTTGTLNAATYSDTGILDVKYSHSIGGIVGKVESCDSISNCLNDIEINNINYSTTPGAAVRQYIGGAIGSGSISNTHKLQNNKAINITNGTYYSLVYVGGVIGRVINSTVSNGVYLNNADINFNVNDNNYKAYISGVINVISETADAYDTFSKTIDAATVQAELDAQTAFEFTSLSNAGLLNIDNGLSASKYPAKYGVITTITNGIDIRTAGISYSYLTKMNVLGGYNLNYHYERTGSTIKEVANDAQSIDMSMMDEYAPAFNADNKVAYLDGELHLDTNYLPSKSTTIDTTVPTIETTVNLERVYNYQQSNYISNKAVNAYTLQISGCINGRNFNLKNIRNDGAVKVYFTQSTLALGLSASPYFNYFGDYKKLKVYGVMEEVSLGHKAEDIYNGGNITISSANGIVPNYTMYIGGVCYKNVGNDDPGTSLMIERGYVGSLHNTINNGDIRITHGNILDSDQTASGQFYSQSRIGGICAFNCSTISQTFNLGDIYNVNSVYENDSSAGYGSYDAAGEFEVETGGICFIQQNELLSGSTDDGDAVYTKANIIDSANNGTVISLNTGSENAWTNAGGFVGRNDRGEDATLVNSGDTTSVYPHLQKIQYCINYGDVFSYNNYSTDNRFNEPQAKAAGFICLGLCSVVDVINYGNIYGTKLSSGMFGYVHYDRMNGAGANVDSPVNIANAINYGRVTFLNETSANLNAIRTGEKIDYDEKSNIFTTSTNQNNHQPVGALIAMLYGAGTGETTNQNMLRTLNVKNLVNFNDETDIVGECANTGSVTHNNQYKVTALQYMATTKTADYSPAPFNTDRTNYYSGINSYSKDTVAGDASATKFTTAFNGGIFNENYTLRTAPALTYDTSGNIDQNNTDNFIADYIQFVPYSKVNDYLVEKIGLKEIVEANAYDNAVTNVELIKQVLLKKYAGPIEDKYIELLNNKTIVESKGSKIADAIVEYLQENPDKADDIAKILVEDEAAVKQILSASEIQTIITKLLNSLTETEIDNLLISAINTYGLDGFVNDDANLEFIGNIINKFANQDNIADSEKTLIINIFNTLVQNDACVEAYVDSLTEAEKETLANSIYNLVKDDPEIIEIIADTYFETLVIDNNTDLTTLKNAIIQTRITNGATLTNYPITDQEYIDMYTELMLPTMYTNADVQEALNKLVDDGELSAFINKLINVNDENSEIYNFIQSGLQSDNIGSIYLPVSDSNYVAYVNSSTFVYGGNSGSKSDDQNYTGTAQDILGTTSTTKSEIYINDKESVQRSVRIGRNNRNIYFYWTLEETTASPTGNRYEPGTGNNNDSDYYQYYIVTDGNAGNNYISTTNTETGVYATAGTTRVTITYGNNSTNLDLYEFTNIEIYDYIDYVNLDYFKDNFDQTVEVLNQMIVALDENDIFYDEDNASTVATYLYNIYINSSANKASFLKLLFPDASSDADVDTALAYLNNNVTTANVSAVLNNISNKTAQANIVKLLNTNASYYIEILGAMLQNLDSANNYDIIKTIVGDMFTNGYGSYDGATTNMVTYITNMIYSNNAIWDGLTVDEKLEILSYLFNTTDMGVDLLVDAVNNNKLTTTEYTRVVKQLIIADPYNLYNYYSTINPNLNDDIMAEISAIIVASSESLFTSYTGLTETGIIEQLESLGVDSSIVTDFTGIYALASSMGIEAGLFLPDNISLIDLDKYYTNDDGILVNDPEWRGGTYEEPNAYTEGVRSVNYKVYYEMKQLKKSIATIIFKMELTDEDNEYVVDNNLEYDYYCNYKVKDDAGNPVTDVDGNHIILNEVYFYIPINNDILYKDNLYINMTKGTYELSYGATFDEETNKFEITLQDSYVVGEVLEDTFVVQAEDTNVKTKYTLYVTITNPAYLDPLNSVTVDGVASATTTATKAGLKGETVTDAIVNTAVKGYNGKIILNYGTINMNNGLSLLSNVNVYKTSLTALPTSLPTDYSSYITNILTKGSDYVFNDVVNNGIVVINGVNGTGFENNSYPAGTVFFDISLDNYQTKGIYLVEIEINEGAKYYTFFEKAASNQANLTSLTFNGQTYINSGSDVNNLTAPSTVQFGRPLTDDFFAYDGVLANDLTFASLSCISNGDYFNNLDQMHIYKKGDSNLKDADQSYRIALKYDADLNKYVVSGTYSSGSTTSVSGIEFDYLIMIPNSHKDYKVFNDIEIGDVAEVYNNNQNTTVKFKEQIYLDSILTSPLSTFKIGTVKAEKVNDLYQYTIEILITAEDGTPNTFTHYITEETYNTYLTRIYVNGGVEVDEIIGDDATEQAATYSYEDTFEKTEAPSYRFEYSLDHFYTVLDSTYFSVQFFDATGSEIDTPEGVSVIVTEGLDFEVEFSEDAESTDYYFALVYSNSVEFNTSQINEWEVVFKKIHIEKLKNRNSYLDNITFFSESVTASIRTMITADVIGLTEYQKMLSDPTREIVCLPGQIYYNEYTWAYDNATNTWTVKEDDFYVIGLVNRTELDYYTPDFTLPEGATVYRTETVSDVLYRYVPYYVDNLQALTNFLVSEDGTSILDAGGNAITVTNATTGYTSFTYNGNNYTISPVAGYQTFVYNNTTIENTSLRTDFNEFGSYDEDAAKFNFVNYRVYAEIYSELTTDADKAKHVTDYKVAAQDLTNNIRFNLTVKYSDGCDINSKIKNIFVEFVCYALPADVVKENPERSDYLLYNKAGLFAYFDDDNILSHGNLKSNTSGYYSLFVSLPDGYNASFTVTDKGTTTTYDKAGEFLIASSITARTIEIVITINNIDGYTPEWGVHVKNESNDK